MSTSSSWTPKSENESRNGGLKALPRNVSSKASSEISSHDLPDLKSSNPATPYTQQRSHDISSRPLPASRQISTSRPVSSLEKRSHSNDRSTLSGRGSSPTIAQNSARSEYRDIIVESFAPRVVVHSSSDAEELVKGKGFDNGLEELVKPFGEHVQGKVIIRDSVGGSKAWDDFGIRFVSPRQLRASSTDRSTVGAPSSGSKVMNDGHQSSFQEDQVWQFNDLDGAVDRILQTHLQSAFGNPSDHMSDKLDGDFQTHTLQSPSSPTYSKYLRAILSSIPAVPYESFAHPVACLIAVTAHNPAPIEALRSLYAETGHAGDNIPPWVGIEYLRYYVLIHDEEEDDIVKSTALFDLMKRHFGLHCHLLRLRSSECVETDDDSARVPDCEWLSAEQESEMSQARGIVV